MAFISAAYSSATVPPSFTNFGRAELFLIGSILESEEESDVISWKWGKGFFTKLFRSDKHKLQSFQRYSDHSGNLEQLSFHHTLLHLQ